MVREYNFALGGRLASAPVDFEFSESFLKENEILFDSVSEIFIKTQMVCNGRKRFDQRECSPKLCYIFAF